MKLVRNLHTSAQTVQADNSIASTNEFILDGYVNEKGELKPCSSSSLSTVDLFKTHPCLSRSLLVNPSKGGSNSNKPSSSRKRSSTSDVVDMEPMAVHDILYNQGVLGQKVINFIRENKYIDISHQTSMLRILTDYAIAKGSTYYPSSAFKTSMAKGIVRDFPELADDDNQGFLSWYDPLTCKGIIQTKYQTLREAVLTPQEKKNKTPSASKGAPKKSRGQTATNQDASMHLTELSPELVEELSNTRGLPASPINLARISNILNKTFPARRLWIHTSSPSCTEILTQYYHLGSYEGKMILQEFQQMNPLANDFVEVFKRWAPHILEFAKKTKPEVFDQLCKEFSDDNPDKDNIVAFLILPKLLPTVANSKTMKPWELEHLKTYKNLIDQAPVSSSIVQIVPFGTNVTLQVSLETPRSETERKTPIFPFLLWTTSDKKQGQMYLKIDQKSFYIGTQSTPDLFLRGIDLNIKSHYCFNLQYHPYLRTTYNFIETLYGINQTKNNCVTKFTQALRNISTA